MNNLMGPKIRQQNGFCWGGSGESFESTLFEVFTRNHQPAEPSVEAIVDILMEFQAWGRNKSSDFKTENSYIFVVGRQIFETFGGIVTIEREEFAATGSGWEYATTAMYLGKTPQEACQVAIDLTPWCCGPIQEKVISF